MLRRARRDRAMNRRGLVLVDDGVANERRRDHDLDRRHAAGAVARGSRRCEIAAFSTAAS